MTQLLLMAVTGGSLFGWGYTLGENRQMQDEIAYLEGELEDAEDDDDYRM